MSVRHSIISKGLSLLIIAGLGALIWFVILRPAQDWKNDAIAQLSASQSENTKLVASLSRLNAKRAQLPGDTSLAIIWSAKRMGEATALVQSEISKLAAKHSIFLRSVTPVSSRDIPFTSAIGFRIEGEATLDELATFLIALEAYTPALIIENAILRRLTRPGRTAAQPDIFVQLNLIAPVVLDEEEKT